MQSVPPEVQSESRPQNVPDAGPDSRAEGRAEGRAAARTLAERAAEGQTDGRLADWFKPGVDVADVGALAALNQSRTAIQALVALFTGTEAAVMIRLLVLRELAGRGNEPFFTAAQLRARFPYFDEAKLEHLIGRLRVHGLLAWDGDNLRYSISPMGRMLIAALGSLLKHSEDGDEVGYLAAQLAASGALGTVTPDELQHLLSRLVELKDEFERAILSGSEARIRLAGRKLDAVWRWVDKGTDILARITADDTLSSEAHRLAQRIGQVQSELLRMSGAFQRALNQLESQKVHLGATGLSSADVGAWLRSRSAAQLVSLLDGAVAPVPAFSFALGDIALDVAEYELVDKLRPDRIDVPLPQAADAPRTEGADVAAPDYGQLDDWTESLRSAPPHWPLADAIPHRDYELSSYRMSLLALLGDRESASLEGPVTELARLKRRLKWTGGIQAVHRDGVAEISEGFLEGLAPEGAPEVAPEVAPEAATETAPEGKPEVVAEVVPKAARKVSRKGAAAQHKKENKHDGS